MKAKRKEFIVNGVQLNTADDGPLAVEIVGRMRIDGSPQANFREIYSRVSVEAAEQLIRQLRHVITLAEMEKS